MDYSTRAKALDYIKTIQGYDYNKIQELRQKRIDQKRKVGKTSGSRTAVVQTSKYRIQLVYVTAIRELLEKDEFSEETMFQLSELSRRAICRSEDLKKDKNKMIDEEEWNNDVSKYGDME